MDSEIQLISDGDGLAVIGDPKAVERFLASEGLPSRALGLPRLSVAMGTGTAGVQAASQISANSGRWVKLTKESAQLVKKYGLRTNSKTGVSTAVVKGSKGQIRGFVEFAKGPGALLSNPAVLAGAAGIMAQVAMQQAMDEVTDYLAIIDEKVDNVLRAQQDAVLADMIGVDLVIEEAMTIRDEVGSVSETTWSKVQSTSLTIARTQAYALRQLDALAENVEEKIRFGELAKMSKEAGSGAQQWLAVLARCFQLQDAIAVLELDRVLGASPDELNKHRLALKVVRRNRLDLIAGATVRLIDRMSAASGAANAKVLLHPIASAEVVRSGNEGAAAIILFHERLGIKGDGQSLEATRWLDAASEARGKVVATGVGGVGAARRVGGETVGRATSVAGKLSSGIAERARWRRSNGDDGVQQDQGARRLMSRCARRCLR